jgi:uncharacterized protein
MRKLTAIFLAALAAFLAVPASATTEGTGPQWQPWSDTMFEQARREDRFVILYLEAVWCHWCHVMDEKTYSDPGVNAAIAQRFIPVRVDSDSRPDLARRYESYGWPATIVFNANGEEIVKLRGYKDAAVMTRVLEAIIKDPSPVEYSDSAVVTQFAAGASLDRKLREELARRYRATHDFKAGGFRQSLKFVDRDTIEFSLLRSASGDATATKIARQTLDGALNLIDPVWGGMYQYSTDGDWKHAHFEKILPIQADALRLYALAYAQYRDPRYLKAARDIHRYLEAFLKSPEGAFYASQDADLVKGRHGGEYFARNDEARRALGIPAIDKHLYARENGWTIQALTALFDATGGAAYLEEARAAAQWAIANRALDGGGFRHDTMDRAGPFLEDTLAMGRGFMALYASTGERQWLARAEAAMAFIETNFRNGALPGYLGTPAAAQAVLKLQPRIDENVALARFANLLAHYTGNAAYTRSAEVAMRFVATGKIALQRVTEAGILLASHELASEPVHITIVGHKDDADAAALQRAALAFPAVYRRIEWWDTREGAMPNPDVQYPSLARAAAFVCHNKSCSRPLYSAKDIIASAEPAERNRGQVPKAKS